MANGQATSRLRASKSTWASTTNTRLIVSAVVRYGSDRTAYEAFSVSSGGAGTTRHDRRWRPAGA